jgi:hypothetical protein
VHDDWLKSLLLLPARLRVALMIARETSRHAEREKLGNVAKREECCGLRPRSFPDNSRVETIPELKTLLRRTSTINAGYSPYYCCTVCGQEWYESFIPEKFGGTVVVCKAT